MPRRLRAPHLPYTGVCCLRRRGGVLERCLPEQAQLIAAGSGAAPPARRRRRHAAAAAAALAPGATCKEKCERTREARGVHSHRGRGQAASLGRDRMERGRPRFHHRLAGTGLPVLRAGRAGPPAFPDASAARVFTVSVGVKGGGEVNPLRARGEADGRRRPGCGQLAQKPRAHCAQWRRGDPGGACASALLERSATRARKREQQAPRSAGAAAGDDARVVEATSAHYFGRTVHVTQAADRIRWPTYARTRAVAQASSAPLPRRRPRRSCRGRSTPAWCALLLSASSQTMPSASVGRPLPALPSAASASAASASAAAAADDAVGRLLTSAAVPRPAGRGAGGTGAAQGDAGRGRQLLLRARPAPHPSRRPNAHRARADFATQRAMADQLQGPRGDHRALRREIVDYIVANKADFTSESTARLKEAYVVRGTALRDKEQKDGGNG